MFSAGCEWIHVIQASPGLGPMRNKTEAFCDPTTGVNWIFVRQFELYENHRQSKNRLRIYCVGGLRSYRAIHRNNFGLRGCKVWQPNNCGCLSSPLEIKIRSIHATKGEP